MNHLSDMELFSEIAKHGGIRKTSENLDITRSTISRRLSLIEERMGIRLIDRSSRQFQLTEAGVIYLSYCNQVADLGRQADWRLSAFRDRPAGKLTITAPINYGVSVLQPLVCEFLKHNPLIDIEVLLADHFLDLIESGVDIAIRLGPLVDSDMHANLLHVEKKRLCCSEGYARKNGIPRYPDQLEDHWCIRYAKGKDEAWHFKKNDQPMTVRPKGRMMINDVDGMKQAVLGDMGITFLPTFLCQKEIEQGNMISLLEEWIEPDLPMYAVYPKRELLPKKVTTFIEFLTDSLN